MECQNPSESIPILASSDCEDDEQDYQDALSGQSDSSSDESSDRESRTKTEPSTKLEPSKNTTTRLRRTQSRAILYKLSEHLPPSSLRGDQLTDLNDLDQPSSVSLVSHYVLYRLFYRHNPACAGLVSASLLSEFILPQAILVLTPIAKHDVVSKLVDNYQRHKDKFECLFSQEQMEVNHENQANGQSDLFALFDLKSRIDTEIYQTLHKEALGSLLAAVVVLCKFSIGTYQFRHRMHAELNLSLGVQCRLTRHLQQLIGSFRRHITVPLAEQIYNRIHSTFGFIQSDLFQKTIHFSSYPGMISLRLVLDLMRHCPDLPWFLVPETFPDEWTALTNAFEEFGGCRYIGLAAHNLHYIKTSNYQQIVLIAMQFRIHHGEEYLSNLVFSEGTSMSHPAEQILNRFLNESSQTSYRRFSAKSRGHSSGNDKSDDNDDTMFDAFTADDLAYLSSFLTIFAPDHYEGQLNDFKLD